MGSYVQSNLLKDEQVVYETKLHWIRFVSLRGLLTLFIAPLIDRLSTITLIGTGGTRETFANIAAPVEFRRQFQHTTP